MKKYLSYLGASLVAIAALSSCNKELTDPNEGIKGGIPFEITAASVDTKTAIDGFATRWVANDAINLFHAVAGTTTYKSDGQFTITAENLDSKKFTGTLASPLEAGNYDWYAIYPYKEQISSPGEQTDGFVYIGHSVAANQNGNNSKAHLCKTLCPLYGVSKSVEATKPVSLEMKHLTSVVEINVTNSNDEPLTVSNISISTDEDIVGSYYINFAGENVVYNPSGANYVKTVANLTVQNGTALAKGETASFYIPIKPHVAENGSVITITVNGYEKTISLTKDVTFTAGKIKKINFNFDVTQTTYIWDLSINSTSEATAEKIAWTNSVADMECTQGEGGTAANNYYPGTEGKTYSSTRFYTNSTLSITPKTGKSLTYYVFEATSEGYATALANSTWTNAKVYAVGTTVTVIATDPSLAVSAVIGATCGFTKVECHTDAPVFAPIISANPTSINVPAAGDVCTINYSIVFPVDGKSISATSDQDWVNTFDYSTSGQVSFVVDENAGEERKASLTLSYEGADDVTVLVTQAAAGSASSKTVTYTVTSTSAVSADGDIPSGSSATYSSTYSTAKQLTKGNSMTLTLSGYKGMLVKGLTLSMKSNKSAGAGYLSVKAGSEILGSIGSSSSGVTFSNASWYGSYSESYVDVKPTLSNDAYTIQKNENIVIEIGATANSLYCESFTIEYVADPSFVGGSDPVKLATPSVTCSAQTETSLTFSWAAVANASGYQVSTDGGNSYGSTQTETSFTWTGLSASTTKTLYVKAIGDGTNYTDSDAANAEGTTTAGGSTDGKPTVLYTLDATTLKGSNNSYAGNCDIESDGITWNVTGNTTINPWRMGGKSIENVDRAAYTKTAFSKALTSIDVTFGTASSITVNSCKIVYSASADFSNSKEVVGTFAASSTVKFEADYPANCYYKLILNVTVSGSDNKYVQLSKIEFIGNN